MIAITRLCRVAAALVILAALRGGAGAAYAQVHADGLVTGPAAQAWERWQVALQALLDRNADAAEAAFGELLATDPSAFRIALLADRSVTQNVKAGGVLNLELDHEAGKLKENGQRVAQFLLDGREQMNQADDGWYFASIGRFDVAAANFNALIASNPDPVALLEFADRVSRRMDILVQLSDHPEMGEAARSLLNLLQEGERRIKADPTRVRHNLDALIGPPRAFETAVGRLIDSGEYVIPFAVEAFHDTSRQELTRPLLRAIPRIGRAALNPLVIALRTEDDSTQKYLIQCAGEIGYWQSMPYLLQLREQGELPAESQAALGQAIAAITSRGGASGGADAAAEAFERLAELYYADAAELAADPRLAVANVWYWKDGLLQNTEVPTAIFNEIMTMRCCEEALRLKPELKPALALWLAANLRREAQLPAGEVDRTRPENYPSGVYFAQSAGAEYCLMVLARAVDTGDGAVALGAIEALRPTAGPASLLTGPSGRLPLGEALTFPERVVRIRAALALANGSPASNFQNSQNLMPVLSEALMLNSGARNALVVDASEESANAALAALRALGYEAVSESSLFNGLRVVREQTPGVDVIVLASDLTSPGLEEALTQLRAEFRFAAAPIVVLVKEGDRERVATLARGPYRISHAPAGVDSAGMQTAIESVSRVVGATPITPEYGLQLALEAAAAVSYLGETNNSVFKLQDVQAALISALKATDPDLRKRAAQALCYVGTDDAQAVVASVALEPSEEPEMRIAMFASLAEAARRTGNHLSGELIDRLIAVAESEANLDIRTAASRALGALSLPGNPASKIIRNQYGG